MRDHRGFEEDTAIRRRLPSRDDGFEEKGEEGVKSEGTERIGGYRQKKTIGKWASRAAHMTYGPRRLLTCVAT